MSALNEVSGQDVLTILEGLSAGEPSCFGRKSTIFNLAERNGNQIHRGEDEAQLPRQFTSKSLTVDLLFVHVGHSTPHACAQKILFAYIRLRSEGSYLEKFDFRTRLAYPRA